MPDTRRTVGLQLGGWSLWRTESGRIDDDRPVFLALRGMAADALTSVPQNPQASFLGVRTSTFWVAVLKPHVEGDFLTDRWSFVDFYSARNHRDMDREFQ